MEMKPSSIILHAQGEHETTTLEVMSQRQTIFLPFLHILIKSRHSLMQKINFYGIADDNDDDNLSLTVASPPTLSHAATTTTGKEQKLLSYL